MNPKRTWRSLITEALVNDGATWNDVEACTPSQFGTDLDQDTNEELAFTLWAKDRVYFPFDCDCGEAHVRSVPRNPCGERVQL